MGKPHVTKTYGPIHFEDLEPHRFEDLVRQLIYDYKDWQTIEATGRNGNDGGLDIRAYEKTHQNTTIEADNNHEEDIDQPATPMDGNLWAIQVKREKELGPKRVKEIVSEISAEGPPYGYILAASANFSKDSYDVFREELKKKGVMEFYMWGKPTLEDMLYLPKNDRILFTFFGISLVAKKKSRTTEIKSGISIKNKIFRIFGDPNRRVPHKELLIRDLNDGKYPFKSEYPEFDKEPKWLECMLVDYHPLGIWVRTHDYYAYVDGVRHEFDFTSKLDNLRRKNVYRSDDEVFKEDQATRDLINDVWEFLPQHLQGHLLIDEFIPFEKIATIDEKGDNVFDMPHVFAEFNSERGPFTGDRFVFELQKTKLYDGDDWKRIEVFPKTFKQPKPGTLVRKQLELNPETLKSYKEYNLTALFDNDGRYKTLRPRQLVTVKDDTNKDTYLQITHKLRMKAGEYLRLHQESWPLRIQIKEQLGKEVDVNEELNITEVKRVYKSQLKVK